MDPGAHSRKAGSSPPRERARSSRPGKKAKKDKAKKESSREVLREARKEPKKSLKRGSHVRLVEEPAEVEHAEAMDIELGQALVGGRRAPAAVKPPAAPGCNKGLITFTLLFFGIAGLSSLVIVGKRAALILHRPPPPPPPPAHPPPPPPPAWPSPSPPRPPPPPPRPPEPWRTPAVCAAVFAPESKFWRMWGTRETWRQSDAGDVPCWLRPEEGGDYFGAVARGDGCDVNWFEGAKGDLGLRESRPAFLPDRPAGAVLGFDEDLYRFCSAVLGKQQWYDARGTSDFNDELAHRCVDANVNILRVLSTRPGAGWSMCQNLRWQLCAIHGQLPGQQGDAALRFARAPDRLQLAEWQHPTSYPCDHPGGCDGAYAVGDVFFAEACILQRICSNARAMWDSAEVRAVVCDLDTDAVADLARELRVKAP